MSLHSDLAIQLDESSAATFWVQQQVLDALNEAQLEVSARVRYQLSTTTLAISSGADLVALPSNEIMIPQYVVDAQSRKCFSTTQAQLEDWQRAWRNSSPAAPEWLVLWDAEHLRVFPQADAAYTYTLYGVPWPSEIADTFTDIDADPFVRNAIVLRAASKLFELTLPEHAAALAAEAAEFESRYKRTLRTYGADTNLRLRPGTGWQVGQLGDIKVGQRYR